jgi:hypothetical protein
LTGKTCTDFTGVTPNSSIATMHPGTLHTGETVPVYPGFVAYHVFPCDTCDYFLLLSICMLHSKMIEKRSILEKTGYSIIRMR